METSLTSRTPWNPSALILLGLVVLLHWGGLTTGLGLRVPYLVLFAVTLLVGAMEILPAVLVFLLLSLNAVLMPRFLHGLPVVGFLFPFLLTSALLLPFPARHAAFTWWRAGRLDRLSLFWMGSTAVLSTIALVAWASWTDSLGVGTKMMGAFSAYPRWLALALFLPSFALLNAAAEEAVYRGLLQEALGRAFPSFAIVNFLQAAAFASAHYLYGFPNGRLGYAMVLGYGLMLGYLRKRTGGMLAPYLTHVAADLVIAVFLFSQAT